MFCDSEALQCCREWKHLFFLTPQYSNMFHSIREWKLEAWKCKELDNSPPKPLRYIKKRWLAKLSQLRACSACEEGFVVASTLTQHVTAHRLSPVHISSCNLWVLDGGCSRWVVFKDHPWHFPLNERSFWYSQSEVRLGDLNSSCPLYAQICEFTNTNLWIKFQNKYMNLLFTSWHNHPSWLVFTCYVTVD